MKIGAYYVDMYGFFFSQILQLLSLFNFHSSQKPTRKLAATAFKYCDWMKVLAATSVSKNLKNSYISTLWICTPHDFVALFSSSYITNIIFSLK
jgi:hypothetical protein